MHHRTAILGGLFAVFLIVGGSLAVCHADVPQLINYQARLTDSGGNPLNGSYSLTFRIYATATPGPALWHETHTGVAVANGYVNVLLGSVTALPAGLFTNASRYLSIQILPDPEMPRWRLVTVPYAFQAEKAQGLVGNPGQMFASPHTPITEPGPGVGITDTMTVSSGPATITNVTCFVDFNPLGEVSGVWLQSPTGTRVQLVGHQMGGTIVANFDNERFPYDGSMDEFIGETANGTWTLQLQSGTPMGTARLNSWKLYFNETPCTLCLHTLGTRLDLSTLSTREARLRNDVSSETIRLSGPDTRITIGGNGAWGSLQVKPATGNTFFDVNSFSATIGGGGNAGLLFLSNAFGASKIIARGSDGSMDMDGNLLAKANVQVNGNLTVTGTKSAVVKTQEGVVRAVYSDESAEVYLFDRGRGRLVDGEATISLDPVFLQTVTVSERYPLWVQVTPTASCNGIFVQQTGAAGFTVEELFQGRSNATFNWEIGAKRKGFEDRRLEKVEP